MAGCLDATPVPSTIESTRGMSLRSRQWLLFYHESVRDMAVKVQECMGRAARLSGFAWNRFQDGFPDLQLGQEDVEALESFYGCCFIMSVHEPALVFEQLAVLYALPKLRARNFRVILPFFSTGTMERVDRFGQIATAKTLARLLSNTPLGPGGSATLVIFDIHALHEHFYFSDQILVQLRSAIWLLKKKIEVLREECPMEEIAIAFPDDGAYTRFSEKFQGFPMIVCDKIRKGNQRVITIKQGDPKGLHVIIVDDLVQSGGTLIECAKPLKAGGALKVSCFCTHAVFPRQAWKKFVGNDLIHKFWISDSVPPTSKELQDKEPFEVLSLAPLIGKYLEGEAEEI